MELRQRLGRAIEERGALAELARLTGLSHVGIRKIARGDTENPGILTVRKIEAALDQIEAAQKVAP